MLSLRTIVLCVALTILQPGPLSSAQDQMDSASSDPSAAATQAAEAASEGKGRKQSPLEAVLSQYFSNKQLEAHLQDYVKRCAAISRLDSVGKSEDGAELWVLTLSSELAAEKPRPAFRYIGNMHGDEPSGRQLLLGLAEWLCARRGSDAKAAAVLDSMQLALMPTMNPDGFAAKRRGNGNGKDLNRDFPDPLAGGQGRSRGPLPALGTEQPETAAVMRWAASRPFVASASMHEGALVANYPWDANDPGQTGYAGSPDDATFRHLASTYANAHAGMTQDPEFAVSHGITNGAAWYPVYGGLQDWSYIDRHTFELTLELSPSKWPPAETLDAIFNANLQALLALPMTAAFGGLRGFVRLQAAAAAGSKAGAANAAEIRVDGVDSCVTSGAQFGDFYRPLAPGSYRVVVSAPGFANATADVTVPEDGSGVQQDFLLEAVDRGSLQEAADPLAAAVAGQSAPKTGADSSGNRSSGGGSGGGSTADQALLETSIETGVATGLGTAAGSLSAAGGGFSLKALLWAAAAVAALAAVLWAVRRRRRRRRAWTN